MFMVRKNGKLITQIIDLITINYKATTRQIFNEM
jgi:hypothetical protein